MSSLQQQLTPVRFYTPLDPYYYTTDNRPLQDLSARDNELANAVDLVTGGSERASMASASIAQALIGKENFSGEYDFPGGLVLRFTYGFATKEYVDSENPALRYPRMGVHDAVTAFTDISAASTPGRAIKYLVQAKFEDPTEDSRVASAGSETKVCALSIKESVEFIDDGQSEPSMSPDSGAISLVSFKVPYGKTSLTADDIEELGFVPADSIRQIIANGPVDPTAVAIKKVRYELSAAKGAEYVPLGVPDCDIDLTKGTENLEVFVTGLYQHNFTVELSNNRIRLGGQLPEAAEVLVVQTIPVPPSA